MNLPSGKSLAALSFFALLSLKSISQNTSLYADLVPLPGTGGNNVGVGYNTLASNTSGYDNTAIGIYALTYNSLGFQNTALGSQALAFNTYGYDNMASGYRSLFYNTTGFQNTASGSQALFNNTTGYENVAIGQQALFTNISGKQNTAIGYQTLYNNTTDGGTAIGYQSLYNNTTGVNNTAVGYFSLYSNSTGVANVAVGVGALGVNTSANYNTGLGHQSLSANTTGYENTGVGRSSGQSNTTGSDNSFFGTDADASTGNLLDATALGAGAIVNSSDKVRIGDSYVTIVEGPVAYTTSDQRFKTNISESDVKGLEFIKRLRPVVYNFDTRKFQEFLTKNMPDSIRKKHFTRDFAPSTAIRQSGFIAQEVEKAAQEVGYNFNGVHHPNDDNDNYSLSYSQFVVPLVKAVQEQQQTIDSLRSGLKKQDSLTKAMQSQIAALMAASNTNAPTRNIAQTDVELSDKNAIVLNQNVPNPFAEQTTITFNVPESVGAAQILFYDNAGTIIKVVDVKTRGNGQLNVFANDLTSGLYSYTLFADGRAIDSKKMLKQN